MPLRSTIILSLFIHGIILWGALAHIGPHFSRAGLVMVTLVETERPALPLVTKKTGGGPETKGGLSEGPPEITETPVPLADFSASESGEKEASETGKGTEEGSSKWEEGSFAGGKSAAGPDSAPLAESGHSNRTALIRASIERAARYPPSARKNRLEGVVYVSFRVDEKGAPLDITVLRTSGYRALDEEAVRTIKRAAPLPPLSEIIEVPITYRLIRR